jgi:ankyrin repeat protein
VSSNDANVMSGQAAIAAGANANYSRDDWSCLISASFYGHAEMVAMLLNAGADKNAKVASGFTPLFAATEKGHAECLQLLLDAGADKEVKTKKGFTPLLMASQEGHAECLQLLLDAGADKEATTNESSTALLIAAQNGHLECIKYLLKAGCQVNAVNNYGHSALSAAVLTNHADCVRALVKAGADITIQVKGETVENLLKRTNNGDELRAALLSSASRQRICEECEYATRGKMKKCGACKLTYYCSRDCQLANWPLHKQECKACE